MGFGQIHHQVDEHPVFRGRSGGTTRSVYTWLARHAYTDKKRRTKPLGHVVASQARIARERDFRVDTVGKHLNLLVNAGLIVLWEPHVRGRNFIGKHDGKWHGRSAEYLVVALAEPDALERAGLKAELRELAKSARTARKSARTENPQEPDRDENGRFCRSDRTPIPVVTDVATPVVTVLPTSVTDRASETLTLTETLTEETQDNLSVVVAEKRDDDARPHRSGWGLARVALIASIRHNDLPPLPEGALNDLADAIAEAAKPTRTHKDIIREIEHFHSDNPDATIPQAWDHIITAKKRTKRKATA